MKREPSQITPSPAQWIELDAKAYRHNLRAFRRLIGGGVKLMAVIKSNAYGHGIVPISKLAVDEGIDYLGVHCLSELEQIRATRGKTPVMILGPSAATDAPLICALGAEPTVSDLNIAKALATEAVRRDVQIPIHIKIETGTHRQGILPSEIPAWCDLLTRTKALRLQGLHTHYANIEDTTDHTIARRQLANLRAAGEQFSTLGQSPELIHSACSAAAIVMAETHAGLVRLGIAGYGLWPSKETYLSTLLSQSLGPELLPVLSWRTRIAQIKEVGDGEYVGYGCSFRTTHPMRLAVLPVGYFDGYDRRLSAQAHCLVRGRRAPVVGRVCMNMTMIDISDFPAAETGDVVTLIGREGGESITADQLATLCGTINYEIVSRLGHHILRITMTGDGAPPDTL
jgi:alanine racemase